MGRTNASFPLPTSSGDVPIGARFSSVGEKALCLTE